MRRPTRPENVVGDILRFTFGSFSPFRYTGNGKFFVRLAANRIKNPDFVAMAERKVIEVFGRYWHKSEEEAQLITAYHAAGWDCLVIWEDELSNVRDMILRWAFPYEYDEEMEVLSASA